MITITKKGNTLITSLYRISNPSDYKKNIAFEVI